MHSLHISNFGPVKECSIDINRFTVFIGPQSSGKSTISKLIYFFLHIRDETATFILESLRDQKHSLDLFSFKKALRKRFVEFTGPAPHSKDLKICYYYNKEKFITITLDKEKHKFITTRLSDQLVNEIKEIYKEISTAYGNLPKKQSLFSPIGVDLARDTLNKELMNRCNNTYCFDEDLLFIPAGRSLLSTIHDQLQNIHPHALDFPMRQFIERINTTKITFSKSLDDIIRERQALGTSKIEFSAIRKAGSFIKKILKGTYLHDKEGGKVYIDKDNYVKINFASSGQQEVIWILLTLFIINLDRIKAMIFIEEPEAHLFPEAQKAIMEYIAFTFNTNNCHFVISTHSPYILSVLNNFIYAYNTGINDPDVNKIISKELWINNNHTNGYFVNNGTVENIYSSELQMMKLEIVDQVSDTINEEYDKLFQIEGIA